MCLLCACFCEFSLSLLSGLQFFSAWVEGWVFCFLDCAFPLVFPWCWFFLSRFPVLLCLFPFLFVSFCFPSQFSRYLKKKKKKKKQRARGLGGEGHAMWRGGDAGS